MVTRPEFIESTAGKVADELARRGIAPGRRVMITIEPDDWLSRARAFARPQVDGWSDADIDHWIDVERETVQRQL